MNIYTYTILLCVEIYTTEDNNMCMYYHFFFFFYGILKRIGTGILYTIPLGQINQMHTIM